MNIVIVEHFNLLMPWYVCNMRKIWFIAVWFSSNSQSWICLEKVSWIPTHSNWKRILVKTEKQGIRYLCEELSDAWPMKVEHELKMNHTEMSMIRWMCGVKLNERKKSEELGELLGLEPISLMIKKSRLRWFGHVEWKDDNDWVKRCITWKVEGIRQKGHPKKTWWTWKV